MTERGAIGWVVAVLVLSATGCHTSNTWAPMTVAVRDKHTHDPVLGARVEARTLHFFIEWDAIGDPIVDRFPPPSVRGVTGPDGSVKLEVIVDHPVKIIVVAAGYEPQVVDLDRHPALWTPQERDVLQQRWRDADPGPAMNHERQRLEVRIGGS